MNKQELTNKEANVLNAVAEVAMSFANDLEADVAQWEVKDACDFTGRAYSAIVGQLKRKGLVITWEDRINGSNVKFICLTEEGMKLVDADQEEAAQVAEVSAEVVAQVAEVAEAVMDYSGDMDGAAPHDYTSLTVKQAHKLQAAGFIYINEDMVNGVDKVYMVSLTEAGMDLVDPDNDPTTLATTPHCHMTTFILDQGFLKIDRIPDMT